MGVFCVDSCCPGKKVENGYMYTYVPHSMYVYSSFDFIAFLQTVPTLVGCIQQLAFNGNTTN